MQVQDHYGSSGIVPRILAALGDRGGAAISAADFYPYDQFHGREFAATRDHAALLAPGADERVLDIGSGIGGPARFMAATYGCDVTGIDLTPAFVAAATDLTALTGQSDRVRFVQGDAAAMPFPDACFDRACCLYVGMNLADKPAVLAGTARVLRPGARLVWSQVSTGTGDPPWPQPWAQTRATSHLDPIDTLTDQIATAGFDIVTVLDETPEILAHAAQMKAAGRVPTPEHIQANAVVMGDDFMNRRRNFIAGMANGTLRGYVIVAERA